MVFPKVNCLGNHAEGGLHVQGCGGIFPYASTSNDAIDFGVGRRHGGSSVTVDRFP